MINIVNSENKTFHIEKIKFPLLIHGKEGSGASYFSIALIAKFFLTDHKILFFTLKDFATEDLKKILVGHEGDIGTINNERDVENIELKKAITIKSGSKDIFIKMLNRLNDLDERIIYIKNLEDTVDQNVLIAIKNYKNLIISGDVDRSPIVNQLLSIHFQSKIIFSPSQSLNFENIAIPFRSAVYSDETTREVIKLNNQ